MAIKTFTTGEVLTASDTNTYLANSGLVYVTSATVGSGVSSVTVSNAFSSTYENYLITYTGGTGSTSADISFQLTGATGSDYETGLYYASWGVTTPTVAMTTSTAFAWAGSTQTTGSTVFANVLKPFLAQYTVISSQFWSGGIGWAQGRHKLNTSYTGFSLIIGSGTATGGTITVYGYRKA